MDYVWSGADARQALVVFAIHLRKRKMLRRNLFSGFAATAVAVVLVVGSANAQQSSDIDAVKAANAAFYVALSSRDAKQMEPLWANKPYVVNIGPRSKAAAVGYADAVTNWGASHWPLPSRS
jgi:hypothetical protein